MRLTNEDPYIEPGGPLTGDALRVVANWLDTYNSLAQSYFTMLEKLYGWDVADVRAISASDEIQIDLRRWAEELDAGN